MSSASGSSTPSIEPMTTTNLHFPPQVNKYGNPVSPLERVYPKPEAEVNVAEALQRKPLKHTFSHHVQNTVAKSTPTPRAHDRNDMERRKKEFLAFQDEIAGKLSGVGST